MQVDTNSDPFFVINNYENESNSSINVVDKELADLNQKWNLTNFGGILHKLQCKFALYIIFFRQKCKCFVFIAHNITISNLKIIEESEINMLFPDEMLSERIEFKFAIKKWKECYSGASTSTSMPLQPINTYMNTFHSSKTTDICVSLISIHKE